MADLIPPNTRLELFYHEVLCKTVPSVFLVPQVTIWNFYIIKYFEKLMLLFL